MSRYANWFCLLGKTLAPFLMDKLDTIQTKIKWKRHALFTLYFKFWRYFLRKCISETATSCFIYFLFFILISKNKLAFTISRSFFINFKEFHSTLFLFVTVYLFLITCPLPPFGYSRKRPKREEGWGLRTYFFENTPGIFWFLTLPLDIPDKTKLHPWKLHKVVIHPLEILRPEAKSPLETPYDFFLITPWISF